MGREACRVGDPPQRWGLQPARPARMPGRSSRSGSYAGADDAAPLSYGSSRACNATSVGSPADSKSPVALRGPTRMGVAVSWCGRFPAGGERFKSARSAQPEGPALTRVVYFTLLLFGSPADSESPVALRSPLARGLPFRFEPVLYRSNLVQLRARCHQKNTFVVENRCRGASSDQRTGSSGSMYAVVTGRSTKSV